MAFHEQYPLDHKVLFEDCWIDLADLRNAILCCNLTATALSPVQTEIIDHLPWRKEKHSELPDSEACRLLFAGLMAK